MNIEIGDIVRDQGKWTDKTGKVIYIQDSNIVMDVGNRNGHAGPIVGLGDPAVQDAARRLAVWNSVDRWVAIVEKNNVSGGGSMKAKVGDVVKGRIVGESERTGILLFSEGEKSILDIGDRRGHTNPDVGHRDERVMDAVRRRACWNIHTSTIFVIISCCRQLDLFED